MSNFTVGTAGNLIISGATFKKDSSYRLPSESSEAEPIEQVSLFTYPDKVLNDFYLTELAHQQQLSPNDEPADQSSRVIELHKVNVSMFNDHRLFLVLGNDQSCIQADASSRVDDTVDIYGDVTQEENP